jgi:mono/diheme cytochrome c family protein
MKSHPTEKFERMIDCIWKSVAIWAILSAGLSATAVGQEAFDFAHRVVPILQKRCSQCHTGNEKQGGFSLNTRESAMAGGDSEKKILASPIEESELIRRVLSEDPDERMPPEGDRLTGEEVATLREWLASGAPWEPGFSFEVNRYSPPLKPRHPQLPPATEENRTHPIDRILDAYRAERKLPILPVVRDAVFVRRAYLDLVGLLPTPSEVQSYVQDQSADKRERLIRELLNRYIDYAEHWLTFWNDLLRNDYSGTGFITGGRRQISAWLYRALVTNQAYDSMVRELIAPPNDESAGFGMGIRWRGTVSAGQTVEIQFAQNVGQSFLGINLKCASCHDSFIDRWKLTDAYGLAAVYSNEKLQLHRCDKPIGKEAKAAWLFPEIGDIDASLSQPERLKQLAALMTHPENGRFPRTMANRIWHRLMGHGIVHPTDAMETKPWNEDLLDYLGSQFADSKYDLKELIFLIATSEAYRTEVERIQEREGQKEYVYAGPQAKRMTAEQFVDSIWQLTGAAPTAIDAPVFRGNPNDPVMKEVGELEGRWIWSESARKQGGPAAGEKIVFRKKFTVDGAIKRSSGVISCDNSYVLWINGRKVTEDGNWESVEAFDPVPFLASGENEIIVQGINGGNGPNPAALYLEMLLDTGSEMTRIATATDWEVTESPINEAGEVVGDSVAWQKAIEAAGPWGGRLKNDLQQALSRSLTVGNKMARASLVKADFLMRSLGRPNRDQVVTVRPTELTQLEAMDLSNGQTLADWLKQGGQRWHAAIENQRVERGAKSVDGGIWEARNIIEQLYWQALCREPNTAEWAAIEELVGPELDAVEIEDILWAIVMLPEFQYVR